MCGRYTLAKDPLRVQAHFNLHETPHWEPRYNIAPAQAVPIIQAAGEQREWILARWGLSPAWASPPGQAARPPLINCRAETVATKPAFRAAFRERRCLVPADGFYEWQTVGGQKQPHFFQRRAGELFAFAGLWEPAGPSGDGDRGCAIVTTTANPLIATYHDRMPVVLLPEQYDLWLRAGPAAAATLLRPFPAAEMTARAVAPRYVNSARYDGPECIAPLGPATAGAAPA